LFLKNGPTPYLFFAKISDCERQTASQAGLILLFGMASQEQSNQNGQFFVAFGPIPFYLMPSGYSPHLIECVLAGALIRKARSCCFGL
jgi:hypothetical protein